MDHSVWAAGPGSSSESAAASHEPIEGDESTPFTRSGAGGGGDDGDGGGSAVAAPLVRSQIHLETMLPPLALLEVGT